jgi:hypothetical protein
MADAGWKDLPPNRASAIAGGVVRSRALAVEEIE